MSNVPPRTIRWPIGAAGFLTLMISVGLLWSRPFWLVSLLILCSLAIFMMGRSKQVLICYAIGFILGPIPEYFAVSLGAWTYAVPEGYSIIPIWLPFGWGIASVTLWSVMADFMISTERRE